MNRRIDLNADLGEGGPLDELLIPLTSSVNIACGGHAGDDSTMRRAIELALASGVAIGAHPGYEDRANFGRRFLDLTPDQVRESMRRQIGRFLACAEALGATVHHVKPHGALYLQACQEPDLAAAIAGETAAFLPGCALYAPHGSALALAAAASGLKPVAEGFVDRRYLPGGQLVPRSHPDAVIEERHEAVGQALRIATRQEVIDLDGRPLPLPARTLCVHGDGAQALALLRSVRDALVAAGFQIAPA